MIGSLETARPRLKPSRLPFRALSMAPSPLVLVSCVADYHVCSLLKTVGLLVILEHELYPGTVQAFIDAYPDMKAKGWDTRSIPDLFPDNAYYQNAQDNVAAITPMNIIQGSPAGGASSSLPATSTSAAVQTTPLPGKALGSASLPPASSTSSSSAPASTTSTAQKNGGLPSLSAPSQMFAALSALFAFALFL